MDSSTTNDFYQNLRTQLADRRHVSASESEPHRRCAAFYGHYRFLLQTRKIAAKLGDKHTLSSLRDGLMALKQLEVQEDDHELRRGELGGLLVAERIDIYDRLDQFVRHVQSLFSNHEYIRRSQLAGNPCLPCLLACVPKLRDYILDESIPKNRGNDDLITIFPFPNPRPKDEFINLLLSGNEEAIYKYWQLHEASLASRIGQNQKERAELAEVRVQITTEYDHACRSENARQVYLLTQEMLTQGVAQPVNADEVLDLWVAGRLICQIESALASNQELAITDVYYSLHKFDSLHLIPQELQENLHHRHLIQVNR